MSERKANIYVYELNDVYWATISEDKIKIENMSVSRTKGMADLESHYEIKPEKYNEIRSRYGLENTEDMSDVLQMISDSGKGMEFIKWALEQKIMETTFAWYSFGDDD